MQREKEFLKNFKTQNFQALWNSFKMCNVHVIGLIKGKKQKGGNIWSNNGQEVSKINGRLLIHYRGSEHSKQDK